MTTSHKTVNPDGSTSWAGEIESDEFTITRRSDGSWKLVTKTADGLLLASVIDSALASEPEESRQADGDWTANPETGRSNASAEYLRLAKEVERLIRADAHQLISGRADMTARLIVAQLAHVHGLVPKEEAK